MDADDEKFMRLAIDQARLCVAEPGGPRPPPRVGVAVVLDGKLLAIAYRGEKSPGDHAEYTALEKKLKNELVAGATVYTTLEPCTTRNHPKTPCAEHLIDRKVRRVVIGMLDPNPKISGRGVTRLREVNIAIEMFPPDFAAQVEEQNREFKKSFRSGPGQFGPKRAELAPRMWIWALALIGLLVGCAFTYKWLGAEALRAEVYRPLAADIKTLEEAVQVVSPEKPPVMAGFDELQRRGASARIPSDLRKHLVRLAEQCALFRSATDNVRDLAIREMSARILQFRTEEIDRTWNTKISNALREESRQKKGVPDTAHLTMTGLLDMTHEGRSRVIEVKTMEVTGPGGPAFVIRDWLTYPESVAPIDGLWTDLDYLYFNDRVDAWFYQITREDLKRLNTSLPEFLRPVYQALTRDRDFQFLQKTRPSLFLEIADLKAIVLKRVDEPKQFRDILFK